ncbi:PIR Superfamily Protein [Plasmodium ovale curtisi]|uniref:PIR Superfamily Protein n=1 Tax=Plasmodium ovale curtisi TaxID=864141 RepID=A0A1A8VUG2_PLAOA|nr:PIR Superfamily Protein [Plasmodium ovale curtisi]
MAKTDKDLDDLPSFRFHTKLDEGYEHLWNYDNFFDTIIKVQLGLNRNISNIENSLLKAFIYVSNMRTTWDQYEERWDYLCFWMGDKVNQIVHNISDFADIIKIVNSLKKHVHPKNEEYNKDLFKIAKDQLINLKKFYDFSQNHKAIEVITSPSDYECNDEYNNYTLQSYKLYEYIEREFLVDTTTPYCNIFRNIEKNNPKVKSTRLICHHIKKPVSSEEGRFKIKHGLEDESSRRNDEQGSPMGPRGVSSLHGSSESQDKETSPTNSSNPTAIILPIFGLLCIFFILYKFTPLGTLIHDHFLKRKINQWNEETVDESFAEKYKPQDENSLVNIHNIGYNPIGNR